MDDNIVYDRTRYMAHRLQDAGYCVYQVSLKNHPPKQTKPQRKGNVRQSSPIPLVFFIYFNHGNKKIA